MRFLGRQWWGRNNSVIKVIAIFNESQCKNTIQQNLSFQFRIAELDYFLRELIDAGIVRNEQLIQENWSIAISQSGKLI